MLTSLCIATEKKYHVSSGSYVCIIRMQDPMPATAQLMYCLSMISFVACLYTCSIALCMVRRKKGSHANNVKVEIYIILKSSHGLDTQKIF